MCNRKLPNACPQHKGYCACAMFSTYVQPKSWTQNRPISRCLQTGDAIDLTSGRRAELKHEAVESWSYSHAPAPARQSACSQSYQGVFDCINVPLVNVVERMSARNVGATAHYVFVHWSTYNRKLPNVCPQHEGCCACAVFSTCAQHVHCPNLELKSDWFHVVHGSVAPLAVAGGWGAELKHDVTCLCSVHWSLQSVVTLRSLHNQKTRHSCHGHYSFLSWHTSRY